MSIFRILPNRVWRSYGGGKLLDTLAGSATPADSHFPEDWIFSTTKAVNPGREHIAEGVSQLLGPDDREVFLTDLVAKDPDYFLGGDFVRKYGARGMFLVKYLDAAIRLHFQVHPTIEFSKKFLGAASGKTEAYHILSVRPDQNDPYILVGFQRPPPPAELKRMIETQDLEAIAACFDKIPVKVGDTFIIPGGRPHAIGEGVLMVEVMEPTDFVVRFEFEKYGYVLPESARFMNRGIDFGLTVFDLSPLPLEKFYDENRSRPERVEQYNAESHREKLIWEKHTRCFSITRSRILGNVNRRESSHAVFIVLSGEGEFVVSGKKFAAKAMDRFFLPAGLGEYEIYSPKGLVLLECFPPV